MTQKNMAYDHPAYLARQSYGYGQNAAGASTNFGKFVAFTTLNLYAIQAAAITAGTSTQTAWNGTGTVVNINGDQFYGIHVFGGNGAAATTATHGPFSLSYGTGTITSTSGVFTRVQLSGTGTTGNVQSGTNTAEGGITLNPGDTFHILRGTDATAVSAFAIEYAVQSLANVTTGP
jgi:hypothetical protein